jgi:hypothetical protein
MSHNVAIEDLKITDLGILESAIAVMQKQGKNIKLSRGKKTFRTYHGQPTDCDHVIELPDRPYDIGLKSNGQGGYNAVYDPYLTRVHGSPIAATCELPQYGSEEYRKNADKVGIGLLMQEYAAQTAENAAAREGKSARRVTGDNGTIYVEIEQ